MTEVWHHHRKILFSCFYELCQISVSVSKHCQPQTFFSSCYRINGLSFLLQVAALKTILWQTCGSRTNIPCILYCYKVLCENSFVKGHIITVDGGRYVDEIYMKCANLWYNVNVAPFPSSEFRRVHLLDVTFQFLQDTTPVAISILRRNRIWM